MVALSILNIAFNALRANKLRSGLTFLGIMIGVTSVMTIISALEGMMGSIESQLARLGPSTFVVARLGMITSHEQFLEAIKRKRFNMEMYDYIEDGCTLCEKTAARVYSSSRVKYKNNSLRRVTTVGASAPIIDIVDIEVEEGRFYSYEDELYRRRVVFIGATIQEELFEGVDPLGKDIRINGTKYTVIGIAKKQGSSMGNNPDNFVMIPLSTFAKQFGDPNQMSLSFLVKAISVEKLPETMDQVRVILRSMRHVPYNEPDDFSLLTADNILATLNSITKIFRFGLVGIASISLVVGGIVVMNIMMVSVSERTREIGIRKSIGAKQKHILLQFLYESLLMTLTGGIVGIVLGYLIAEWLMGMIDMQISPSMLAIVSGFSVSTGIGLIFGIYPAMKAARLDPIKALSYE